METVPAPEFKNWTPDWAKQVIFGTSVSKTQSSSPTAKQSHEQQTPAIPLATQQSSDLTPDEHRFLQAVIDSPALSVSEYPKRARMAPRKAMALRKVLKKKGLVQEELVQRQLRGRPAIHITPTKLAIEMMSP